MTASTASPLPYPDPRDRLAGAIPKLRAFAISLALELPQAQVTAIDASAAALAVARRNAERHSARLRFVTSDWFDALGEESFDLIVANPPYIAAQGGPGRRR